MHPPRQIAPSRRFFRHATATPPCIRPMSRQACRVRHFGGLAMIERDEMNAIYRAILAAARQKWLARYSDLMALQGLVPGQPPKVTLRIRLYKLLQICRRRDWPAMSAFVVGKHDALLSDKGLAGFVEGARNAGYAVQNPREFEAGRKRHSIFWPRRRQIPWISAIWRFENFRCRSAAQTPATPFAYKKNGPRRRPRRGRRDDPLSG